LATSTVPSSSSTAKAEMVGTQSTSWAAGTTMAGGPAWSTARPSWARTRWVPGGVSVPGTTTRTMPPRGRDVGFTTTGPSWSTRAASAAVARVARPSAMSAASL
jgi:hypothetical protein